MRNKITMVLVAVAFAAPVGLFAQDDPARLQRLQMESILQRADQIQMRVKMIGVVVDQGSKSEDLKPQYNRVKLMSDAVGAMAEQIKIAIKLSHRMLENETVANDVELERDLMALRTQMGHMASNLDNALQYLEHMIHRLDKCSRGNI